MDEHQINTAVNHILDASKSKVPTSFVDK